MLFAVEIEDSLRFKATAHMASVCMTGYTLQGHVDNQMTEGMAGPHMDDQMTDGRAGQQPSGSRQQTGGMLSHLAGIDFGNTVVSPRHLCSKYSISGYF